MLCGCVHADISDCLNKFCLYGLNSCTTRLRTKKCTNNISLGQLKQATGSTKLAWNPRDSFVHIHGAAATKKFHSWHTSHRKFCSYTRCSCDEEVLLVAHQSKARAFSVSAGLAYSGVPLKTDRIQQHYTLIREPTLLSLPEQLVLSSLVHYPPRKFAIFRIAVRDAAVTMFLFGKGRIRYEYYFLLFLIIL